MNIAKKIALMVLWISILGYSFAELQIPGNPTIYNEDQGQYIEASDISNPIRDWAYWAINNENITNGKVEWLSTDYTQIEDYPTAQGKTLAIINNFINYALGLVSLVALIYLIYHGILMVTAWWDDAQYKKWLKWIKFAAIAIVGIWLSWILVSSVFWLLNLLTKK
jgi:hypothetical protein